MPPRPPGAATQPPPDLAPLLPFLAVVNDPAFRPGTWRGGERRDDGSVQMPFFGYAAEADALVQAASRANWVRPEIDWGAFAAGPRYRCLRADPAALASASANEIAQLLTTLIRGDRFSEGLLAGAFADGTVRRLLERVAQLAQGVDPPGAGAGGADQP